MSPAFFQFFHARFPCFIFVIYCHYLIFVVLFHLHFAILIFPSSRHFSPAARRPPPFHQASFARVEAWLHSLVAKQTNERLLLYWVWIAVSFLSHRVLTFYLNSKPRNKMFISSMAKKNTLEKDSLYNLRPLPSRGTKKRNPDEDFILRGRRTPVR